MTIRELAEALTRHLAKHPEDADVPVSVDCNLHSAEVHTVGVYPEFHTTWIDTYGKETEARHFKLSTALNN